MVQVDFFAKRSSEILKERLEKRIEEIPLDYVKNRVSYINPSIPSCFRFLLTSNVCKPQAAEGD